MRRLPLRPAARARLIVDLVADSAAALGPVAQTPLAQTPLARTPLAQTPQLDDAEDIDPRRRRRRGHPEFLEVEEPWLPLAPAHALAALVKRLKAELAKAVAAQAGAAPRARSPRHDVAEGIDPHRRRRLEGLASQPGAPIASHNRVCSGCQSRTHPTYVSAYSGPSSCCRYDTWHDSTTNNAVMHVNTAPYQYVCACVRNVSRRLLASVFRTVGGSVGPGAVVGRGVFA